VRCWQKAATGKAAVMVSKAVPTFLGCSVRLMLQRPVMAKWVCGGTGLTAAPPAGRCVGGRGNKKPMERLCDASAQAERYSPAVPRRYRSSESRNDSELPLGSHIGQPREKTKTARGRATFLKPEHLNTKLASMSQPQGRAALSWTHTTKLNSLR